MEKKKFSIDTHWKQILALFMCVILVATVGVASFSTKGKSFGRLQARDEMQGEIVETMEYYQELYDLAEVVIAEYSKLDEISDIVYPSDVEAMKHDLNWIEEECNKDLRTAYDKYTEYLDEQKELSDKFALIRKNVQEADELMEKASTSNNPDKYINKAQKKLLASDEIYTSAEGLVGDVSKTKTAVFDEMANAIIKLNSYGAGFMFWDKPVRYGVNESTREFYEDILKLYAKVNDQTLSRDDHTQAVEELVQKLVASSAFIRYCRNTSDGSACTLESYKYCSSYDKYVGYKEDENGNYGPVYETIEQNNMEVAVGFASFGVGTIHYFYQYVEEDDGRIKIWDPVNDCADRPAYLFYADEEIAKINSFLNPDEKAIEAENAQIETVKTASNACAMVFRDLYINIGSPLVNFRDTTLTYDSDLQDLSTLLNQAKIRAGLEPSDSTDDILNIVANNSPAVVADNVEADSNIQTLEDSQIPMASTARSSGSDYALFYLMLTAFAVVAVVGVVLNLSEKKYEQNPR
ncbi:hypothetical protein [Butyrivibrio proteoclasticus]|uniref:hypothetical protein n=1 Tax=Butyrivibrio proteoclasticus TaxID=43305 RepID=UPI00047E1F33|nr:hypothetical protein [Butyrivibrio proteoclasticus]